MSVFTLHRQNIFNAIITLLALSAISVIIIFLDEHAFYAGSGLTLLGILLILFCCKFYKNRNHEWWKELQNEFRYYTSFAWPIGAGFASFIIGIYILILFKINTNISVTSHIISIYALFISILLTTLGVHSLYKKTAPITNVSLLLKDLTKDLKEYNSAGSKIIIAYPALNIGYHRTYERYNGIPKYSSYYNFYNSLCDIAKRDDVTIRIYTYPEKLYEKLWTTYTENTAKNNIDKQKMIKDSNDESIYLLEQFRNTSKKNSDCFVREFHPDRFPQHVIVIGNITYLIASYGLPMYKEDQHNPDNLKTKKFNGYFDGGEHEKATLLSYRHEDPNMAELVYEHLEKHYTTVNEINGGVE
ncbi:hypothetical protein KAR48_11130 [bacterium]|nr:hypothetical protein [bacterium]